MKRIILMSVFLGSIAGTLTAAAPATWDKTVSVEVRAPDHKFNGKPWDINPMIILPIPGSPMDSVGNPNPDMMLCIVDGTGESDCIYDKHHVNYWKVPYSICRDSLVCNFTNVKVPSTGYFGILVVDLDWLPRTHDYMIAAEIRSSGPESPTERFRIEELLRGLIQKWGVVDAPDEFPEAALSDCTLNDPCFGSASRGIPSVAISTQKVGVCGMPISGTLSSAPESGKNAVALRFNEEENRCTGLGKMEYMWQFGDGSIGTTTDPAVDHIYPGVGTYDAKMTPRCVRKQSVCDAPPSTAQVRVTH